MADTKISALTDGTTLAATDRIPIARAPFASGDNRYISGTEMAAFVAANSGGLDNVVEDVTPQLGGDLDSNGFDITDATTVALRSTTTISSATVGTFYIGANRFAHNYTPAPSVSGLDENTWVGHLAGNFTMGPGSGADGGRNVGVGARVMLNNTTGQQQTGVGHRALQANTSGTYNTGIGAYANWQNVTGSNNTMVGSDAGYWNAGTGNCTLGTYTFQKMTGSGNIAIGLGALQGPDSINVAVGPPNTSTDNIAIGSAAMKKCAGAVSNTAVGNSAMINAATAANNVAFGEAALAASTADAENVAIGGYSLTACNGGNSNVAVGFAAGEAISTGDFNTILNRSARILSTGSNNVVLGWHAAEALTTGSNNIVIGTQANCSAAASYQLNIGYILRGNMTNEDATSPALYLTTTAGPANYLDIANSVASSPLTLTARGTDTDVSISVVPKGNGGLVSSGYIKGLSTTFASLPSAATAGSGARAFITNCNTTTFLATAAGGGSNKVPVVSDGTNWLVG